MRTSKELQTGKAGEYLVCADLILKGFVAFPSEQGLPYDVLLDTGTRIFRVQVKTTTGPRVVPQRAGECKAYIFNVKRTGRGNTKRYSNADLDLFALVSLDTRKVAYLVGCDMPDTLNIRVDALKGTHRDERGVANYKRVMELATTVSDKRTIAKQLDLHESDVYRMFQKGFVPHETGARYFSHFEREPQWFAAL